MFRHCSPSQLPLSFQRVHIARKGVNTWLWVWFILSKIIISSNIIYPQVWDRATMLQFLSNRDTFAKRVLWKTITFQSGHLTAQLKETFSQDFGFIGAHAWVHPLIVRPRSYAAAQKLRNEERSGRSRCSTASNKKTRTKLSKGQLEDGEGSLFESPFFRPLMYPQQEKYPRHAAQVRDILINRNLPGF